MSYRGSTTKFTEHLGGPRHYYRIKTASSALNIEAAVNKKLVIVRTILRTSISEKAYFKLLINWSWVSVISLHRLNVISPLRSLSPSNLSYNSSKFSL